MALIVFASFVVLYQMPIVKAVTIEILYSVSVGTGYDVIQSIHPSSTTSRSAVSQTFTTTKDALITAVGFSLSKSLSPSGYIACRISNITSDRPNESEIWETSTAVNSATLPAGAAPMNFSFSHTVLLPAGRYVAWIFGINATINNTNKVNILGTGSNVDSNEKWSYFSSNTWSSASVLDINMQVYGDTELDRLNYNSAEHTNNENGETSLFSSFWFASGSITCSGYILSLNYGSGYVNNTWVQFSPNNNTWANVSEVLTGSAAQIGATIYYKTFANASNGKWYVTAELSFTLQATVTFQFWDIGHIEKNDTPITNSSTTYTTPTTLKMDALPNATYSFLNWSWLNTAATSNNNPLSFTVTNKTTLTCYFGLGYDAGFAAGAASNPTPTATPTPTGTATPTPAPGDTLTTDEALFYIVAASFVAFMASNLAFKARRRKQPT